jgi:hypothetical protein
MSTSDDDVFLFFSNEYVTKVQQIGDSEIVIFSKPDQVIPWKIERLADEFLGSQRVVIVMPPRWSCSARYDPFEKLHRLLMWPEGALLSELPAKQGEFKINENVTLRWRRKDQ